MVVLIAALTADRGALGRRGQLLYPLSCDLRRFKSLTVGNTVVMGRRTFQSLPKGALPNRHNIVITSQPDFQAPNVQVAHSLEQALQLAAQGAHGDTFIIGGAQVYRQALPYAQCLDLTLIDAPTPADADAFFPLIDPEEWENAAPPEHVTDEKTTIRCSFVTLDRKNTPQALQH